MFRHRNNKGHLIEQPKNNINFYKIDICFAMKWCVGEKKTTTTTKWSREFDRQTNTH